MSSDSLQSLLILLALLIFLWKCFLFWLWGQISKTELYACCQTEALMMRSFHSFADQSHRNRWQMRATSELTEIYLGVWMCPDVEFSFSCCCSLCSEVTSALWSLWGKVFLLLGSGICRGRYQHGSNTMKTWTSMYICQGELWALLPTVPTAGYRQPLCLWPPRQGTAPLAGRESCKGWMVFPRSFQKVSIFLKIKSCCVMMWTDS